MMPTATNAGRHQFLSRSSGIAAIRVAELVCPESDCRFEGNVVCRMEAL